VIALTPRRLALVAVSLGLLATSLVLVVAGNFISWNDVQGTQPRSWHYPMGDLAGSAAAVGALVSLFDRTARHLAGAVVASFVGFLLVANEVAPDFCFVGSEDSFGLTLWEVLLARRSSCSRRGGHASGSPGNAGPVGGS
jgi:peptidoglycan/LPS O-acetylase OafA/YrhL